MDVLPITGLASGAHVVLGREEWIALPDLGLPALRAKVDTGAATSALHAMAIRPFESDGRRMVRFLIQPVPTRHELVVECVAPTIGRRWIISSNGERELRYVIETDVVCGERRWPIAVTLTNRIAMRNRMLLGRQAIQDGMIVVPSASFQQHRLSYDLYPRRLVGGEAPRLRIGLIESPDRASAWRPLRDALVNRGHEIESIDPATCTIDLANGESSLERSGQRLVSVDAVLAGQICARSAHARAILRHLAWTGAGYFINGLDAVELCSDERAMLQTLAFEGMPVSPSRLDPGADEDDPIVVSRLRAIDCTVYANRLLPGIVMKGGGTINDGAAARSAHMLPNERRLALRAARVLGARLAQITICTTTAGVAVSAVRLAPAFDRLVEAGAGGAIIELASSVERDVTAVRLISS